MSKIIYGECIYNCELEKIDVYFEYNNSVIFSQGATIVHNESGLVRCRELKVISSCEVEQYQGPTDASRYLRMDNLVIQGIISFFTGLPLIVYHSNDGRRGTIPITFKKDKIHLCIENIDYTNDLLVLLDKLEKEPDFIISLLDRWRKAIYLKKESCDADLYYDEAILSFFHILELFGEKIHKELKTKLEEDIDTMLYQYFNNYYYSEKQKKDIVQQNKKAVNSLLIGKYLSLSIKVKYFLEKYNLLDENVVFL